METCSSLAPSLTAVSAITPVSPLYSSPEVRGANLHTMISRLPRVQERVPDKQHFVALIAYLERKMPTGARTVEALFTSGSTTGRVLACAPLFTTIQKLRYAGGTPNASFGHQLIPQLQEQWHTGNAIEETGMTHVLTIDSVTTLPTITQWQKTQFNGTQWRGYAALKLACKGTEARLSGSAMEFIEWAGEQDDLRLVISLIQERLTLDPVTLQSLLIESVQVPAVRHGFL